MISIIQLTNPNHFFGFPRRAPEIYLIVMSLYPILSVIPQGIIYRVLFFKRYGELFSDIRIALLISSIAFSFAHLLFQNLFAVCLTFLGRLSSTGHTMFEVLFGQQTYFM
jgi:membrane protease YdiL (CAAX protease family)